MKSIYISIIMTAFVSGAAHADSEYVCGDYQLFLEDSGEILVRGPGIDSEYFALGDGDMYARVPSCTVGPPRIEIAQHLSVTNNAYVPNKLIFLGKTPVECSEQ